MAEAPTPDDINVLLGESAPLDEEPPDPYADENGEFMAAARQALGGDDAKATALQDAVECVLRKHGLIGGAKEPEEADETAADPAVGEGFDDY